uniref:(northern house mosquito) hypothetical protein n=1 Tax=Culex pipiens TaxID=7175 RepID=A0A8D8C6M0_CULPI
MTTTTATTRRPPTTPRGPSRTSQIRQPAVEPCPKTAPTTTTTEMVTATARTSGCATVKCEHRAGVSHATNLRGRHPYRWVRAVAPTPTPPSPAHPRTSPG